MNLSQKESRAIDVGVVSIAELRDRLFLVGGNAGNLFTTKCLNPRNRSQRMEHRHGQRVTVRNLR